MSRRFRRAPQRATSGALARVAAIAVLATGIPAAAAIGSPTQGVQSALRDALSGPPPSSEATRGEVLPRAWVRSLRGAHHGAGGWFELVERDGALLLYAPGIAGRAVRRDGGRLRVAADGAPELRTDGEALYWRDSALRRGFGASGGTPPAGLTDLTGRYRWSAGDEALTLYVLEQAGALYARFGDLWLTRVEIVSGGLRLDTEIAGERLLRLVRRDDDEVTALALGDALFVRAPDGDPAATFKIVPRRPIEDLRADAIAARPPGAPPGLRAPDLVELVDLESTIRLDVRYASANNFMGSRFYQQPRAFLQRPAAEALARVQQRLAADGYGLLVYDAYRPWYVTRMFWEATPERQREFVADPAEGSRHNRGCAVDLTLVDLHDGAPVQMTGGYDEFSERSYAHYMGGTARQRAHRERLRAAMEAEGFEVYPQEWWHFDYRDWTRYPVLNLAFERIGEGGEGEPGGW